MEYIFMIKNYLIYQEKHLVLSSQIIEMKPIIILQLFIQLILQEIIVMVLVKQYNLKKLIMMILINQ